MIELQLSFQNGNDRTKQPIQLFIDNVKYWIPIENAGKPDHNHL